MPNGRVPNLSRLHGPGPPGYPPGPPNGPPGPQRGPAYHQQRGDGNKQGHQGQQRGLHGVSRGPQGLQGGPKGLHGGPQPQGLQDGHQVLKGGPQGPQLVSNGQRPVSNEPRRNSNSNYVLKSNLPSHANGHSNSGPALVIGSENDRMIGQSIGRTSNVNNSASGPNHLIGQSVSGPGNLIGPINGTRNLIGSTNGTKNGHSVIGPVIGPVRNSTDLHNLSQESYSSKMY